MPKIDNTQYNFFNQATKETFTGTRRDFCHKYDISRNGASLLVSGKYKQHNGWVVITKAFVDYANKKKYTISPRQKREANMEWLLVKKNLKDWQYAHGIS